MTSPRLNYDEQGNGLNAPLHFTGAGEQQEPNPSAPRQPEFLPPGEQQQTRPAEAPRREVPSIPSVREIPERPSPEVPHHAPDGPDRERA
jgi:hypothetical protein